MSSADLKRARTDHTPDEVRGGPTGSRHGRARSESIEAVDDFLERAFQMERAGRIEHGAAALLRRGDDNEIEWFRAQPDHWGGPPHTSSAEECIAVAHSFYADAEDYYLEAASQHYYARSLPRDDPGRNIHRLPSPRREELALLRDDYLREDRTLTTDLTKLDPLSSLRREPERLCGHRRRAAPVARQR